MNSTYLCLLFLVLSFGDILTERFEDFNIQDAIEGLADIFGNYNEKCEYTCKAGLKPIKNPHHKPSSNGCGTFGIELNIQSLPEMRKCCDAHDICYDTCNKDKKQCDITFKECLEQMCTRKNKKSNNKNSEAMESCMATAKLMYSGTTALGCQAYLDAQEKACICSKPGKKTTAKTSHVKNEL